MSEEKRLLQEALKHLNHLEYANDSAVARLNSIKGEITAYLANPETEPDYWVVICDEGRPVYIADYKQACHDHINMVIEHHEVAAKWVVRPLYVSPANRRQPLSNSQIAKAIGVADFNLNGLAISVARSIEIAHGIIPG